MTRSLRLILVAGAALLARAGSAVAGGPDVSGEVFYQIMPITWRDSDDDEHRFGDFGGLAAGLDYLQRLGVTSIYLQPVFPSPAYHGYQHGDASRLNPWFGTEDQFLAFVREAHGRGLKVHLDFVAYGISHDSEWFRSAHRSPQSPFDRWLAFTDEGNDKHQGYTFRTWNGSTVGFIHWNLDHEGPVNLVTAWATKWLDPNRDGDLSDGVDGFRLDHAYARAPEGWGATITFWQNWAEALRKTNPDVFVFAEPGDWGNYGADMLTPTGFDAVVTKPFEFAARDALQSGSAARLYSVMDATVAAVPPGKTVLAQINDHDSDRLASVVGGSFERHKAGAAIHLTQPFPPSIYAGDEIGMLGRKASHGSDANDIPMREPFKWKALAGPPMSDYYRIHARAYEDRFSRDHDGRSVEEQEGVGGSLLEEYRRLIALRKASPALRSGAYTPVPARSGHVWAFLRTSPQQTVLVAINLHGEAVTTALDLPGAAAGATGAKDLLTGGTLPAITSITLPGYGYRIIEVPAGR